MAKSNRTKRKNPNIKQNQQKGGNTVMAEATKPSQPQTSGQPSQNSANKPQPKKSSSSRSDRTRGLIIIIAIAILLVAALIALGFFIAGITDNNGDTDNGETIVNDGSDSQADSNNDSADNGSDNNSDDGQTDDQQNDDSTADGSQDGQADDGSTADSGSDSSSDTTSDSSSDDSVLGTDNGSDSSVAGLPENYSYTAGAGDSVSWLARRAMYQYLSDSGAQGLNAAQRLFFEVTLTNQSNPVLLEPGQTRTFSTSTLANIYNQAASLTADQVAAWQYQVNISGYV